MKQHTKLSARLVAGLAVTALLATGCGSSSDNEADKKPTEANQNASLVSGLVKPDTGGTPVKGGTLVVGEYSEARSMDPTKTYTSGSVGGSVLGSVYDTLVRYDWTKHTWEPQLAEALTTKDNGVTWTLKLREGVKFSDGTDLNADAVLGSIGYYLKGYGYNFATWMANVKEMKKVDNTTVSFTMNLPWNTFPAMLGHGPGMILAPAAYKDAATDPTKFQAIGAGPFLFKEYKPTESLTVVANDKYFNGRPNLDAIKFTWPGADSTKNDALDAGDLDTAFIREPIETNKAKAAGRGGMIYVTGAGGTYMINQAKGRPGTDLRIRQAINLALDPEAYYKAIGNTAAVANKNIMPKNSPWYEDVTIAKTDLVAAKKLVDEAKADGWNGVIKYAHLADPFSQKAAVTIQATLQAAGFKVQLEPQKTIADQTKKVFIDKDFDLAIGAFSVGEEAPYVGLAAPLMSTSPSNPTGYGSPEMDAALGELAAATGPTDGAPAMTKVQTIFQKDLPSINLSDGSFMYATTDAVHGLKPSTQLIMLYDTVWMSK